MAVLYSPSAELLVNNPILIIPVLKCKRTVTVVYNVVLTESPQASGIAPALKYCFCGIILFVRKELSDMYCPNCEILSDKSYADKFRRIVTVLVNNNQLFCF
jgi:hypothetical protein